MLLAVSAAASAVVATGDTSKDKIALSNSYAGNTFRQQQLKSWAQTAEGAKKAGIIAEAPAFTTAENQATEQAQQIQNLVLQGYKATSHWSVRDALSAFGAEPVERRELVRETPRNSRFAVNAPSCEKHKCGALRANQTR